MRRGPVAFAALFAVLAAGCTGDGQPTNTTTSRSQAADDFSEKLARATVGDKTVVSNTDPIPVSGVGLVWNLPPGQGSPAKGPFREYLEKALRKKGITKPSEFLDDPNRTCAMVMLNATVPAGAKKNDPIDLHISLPEGSEAKSLKDGQLFECELVPFDKAGNVRDLMVQSGMDVGKNPAVGGDQILLGQTLVRGSGPVIAGTGSNGKDDAGTFRSGVVWGGGRFVESRPYWFVLTDDKNKSARMAGTVAARLNEAFPTAGGEKNKTANAVNQHVVMLNVPNQYRLNHTRFLTVARQVSMAPMAAGDPRRLALEQELLEPATAIPAAVKLEALGADVTPALRVGLESPSPWVRFAAAEALAYLGSTAGAVELAKLAEGHPGVRSHCLTALATLDDGVSTDRLAEMMTHPDPQLRYGAFVALRSANENHSALNGKNVKKTFWLHHVAPDSPGLVHLTTVGRSEIVLFGRVGDLAGGFSFPLGTEFTVTSKPGDKDVTVTRVVFGHDGAEPKVRKCRPGVANVLATLGELGGGYSEAVELVRRADAAKALTGTVALDSAPRGLPMTQLAVLARTDADLTTANLEVARASRADTGGVYDLPPDVPGGDIKQVGHVGPDLARNPGRLFGPKQHPGEAEPEADPAPVPAPTAAPGELNKNPGRLFGK